MKNLFVSTLMFFMLISQSAIGKMADCCKETSGEKQFQGGKIYEINSNKKKLLFTINADLKHPVKEVSVFTSSYVDKNKIEILTEVAVFNQLALQKYIIQQKQINETYELEISLGKMHFSVIKNGKIDTKTRDLPENLVIGPSFVPFLKQHWSEIQDRKKVKAELAVLDRLDTYSFEFEKIRDSVSADEDAVIVRMKPSSTLIAAFVRPVYFVVKADGSLIIELKGRMLPKIKSGVHWEDFEGEAIFAYGIAQPAIYAHGP